MLDRHSNLRQLLCWWLVTALTFAPAACSPTSHPAEETSSDLAEAYDEYPVVVPKRAALLLDRLMVALEKAVESEAAEKGMTNRIPQDDSWKVMTSDYISTFGNTIDCLERWIYRGEDRKTAGRTGGATSTL